MSQGAATLLGEKQDKQESKVEIHIEHVPVQEAPEVATDNPGRSMPSLIDHLVLRMQEFGDQYASSIQAATKLLLGRVDSATKASYASARDEFEGNILEAAGLLNTQRQMIIEEVQALERQCDSRIQEKIVQTEAAVELEEIRIQQMVEDVTMDIPVLMRANAALKEMKAYLEGLKDRGAETPWTTGL